MFDLIAIDWGSKRCGLAFGSSDTGLVLPYDKEAATSDTLHILNEQVKVKMVKKIVLGMPTTFHSDKTEVSHLIIEFEGILKICFPDLEIVTWNERGTTKDAKNKLKSAIKPTKVNKKIKTIQTNKTIINHLAAVQILEDYLKYSKI